MNKPMKKNNTSMYGMLLTCAMISQGHAAGPLNVPISPIISTGSSVEYVEEEPNLWFLLDDSGSMGGRCVGSRAYSCPRDAGSAPAGSYYAYGLIDYDPTTTYVLPKRINGSDMPLPATTGKFYNAPFVEDSNGINPNNFEKYTRSYYNEFKGATNSSNCNIATDKRNCKIWHNYYSSRLRVLKSSLSLSFFDNSKAERLRIGYMSLNKQADNHTEQVLPVLPLYGSDANANKLSFNEWLYSLYPRNGTPLRGRMSELYTTIIKASGGSSSHNPFLLKPGIAYDRTANPKKTCRRNYAVILTDGDWNISWNHNVNNTLATPARLKRKTTEQNDTLPDGKLYTPRSPYTKNNLGSTTYDVCTSYYSNGRCATSVRYNNKKNRTIADIAFAGWKTDMDNKVGNDNLALKYLTINGEQDDGTSPDVATLHGDKYWHPYNDPAKWQHINTFTIGFNVDGVTPDMQVNPPKGGIGGINSAYITNGFKWDVDVTNGNRIISGSTPKDLANAAVAGRGRNYNAKSAQDLISAFNDILDTANGSAILPGIKGSAGAVGLEVNSGNAHFGSTYDAKSFTGELTRTELFSGIRTPAELSRCFGAIVPANPKYGQLCTNPTGTVIIKASDKITARSATGSLNPRRILTVKRENSGTALTNVEFSDGSIDLANLDYTGIKFKQSAMSSPMKKRLRNNFPPEITSNYVVGDRMPRLLKYVKGSSADEGVGKFRIRDYDLTRNVFGAIMRTSPVFTSVPQLSATNQGMYTDDFIKFANRYIYKEVSGNLVSVCAGNPAKCGGKAPIDPDFVSMVYVGSNDGMLHAFSSGKLHEEFAYVPNAVYDNLPKIVVEEGQQSLVDGGIDVQTVNIIKPGFTDPYANGASDWKQILVGAMGGGGKGLYSLDVTNPKETQVNKIAKWEYSDFESKLYQKNENSAADFTGLKSNIGNIIAKPSIVQLSDGTWAAVSGNGYNSENSKAALIVINLDTGKPIQELVIDSAPYTDNSKPNGLGPLYFVAYPHKAKNIANRIDRGYAGDLQGNLWVFDFTNANKNGGVTIAKQNATADDKPLFTAEYSKGVAPSITKVRQPITVAPLVKRHPSKYSYLVHFGTGSLLSQDDLSSEIKNSIYAIWDDWVPTDKGGLSSPRAGTPVEPNQLSKVEFLDLEGTAATTSDGTVKKARILAPSNATTNAPIDWAYGAAIGTNKRGWYVDLLVGERAWQSPSDGFGAKNTEGVNYDTVRYKDDSGSSASSTTCSAAGSVVATWRMSFNPSDGTQMLPFYGTLDVNGDGTTSKGDLVEVTLSDGVTKVKVPLTGYIESDKVVFSSTPANLYRDPNLGGGDKNRFCSYKVQLNGDSSGGISPNETCRVSNSGAWTELK